MGEPFLLPGGKGVGADEKKRQKETTPYVESVWSENMPHGHRAEQMAAITEFGGATSPSGRLDTEQEQHVGQKPGQRHEYDVEAEAFAAAETVTMKMSMPEACVLSTAHHHRDGPSGKTPQQTTQLLARMPEPCIPSTFRLTAGQTMPEPSIPPFLPVPPALPPQRYDVIVDDDRDPISTASLKTTGLRSSEIAPTTLGAIIPPSTYDPDSLPAPQWTTTTSAARKETPQTTVENCDKDEYDDDDTSTVVAAQGSVMRRIASILENIPRSERRKMTKEQVAVIVYQALNERRGMSSSAELSGTANPTARQTEGLLPTFIAPSSFLAPFADPTLAYEEGEYVDGYTVPASWQRNDAEWFYAQGGGVLPSGWSAHYDHAASLWYFCNYNTFPPTSTWQDPRGTLGLPERAMLPMAVAGSGVEQIAPVVALPPQLIPEGGTAAAAPTRTGLQPALTRQEADHLVSQFTAFEAQRAVGDSVKDGPKGGNSKGPVTNEIQREEREAKEIERALQTTQTAARRADEAIKRGDVERFQTAQEEMIRARGVLDRISNDALLRQSIIPASLNAYQGTTRGFDQDPLYSRPRTHYTTNNKVHPTQCAPALPMGPALPQPIIGLPPHNSYPTVMSSRGNNNNTSSFAGKMMGKLMKPKGSTQGVYPGMILPPGAFPPAPAPAPPTAWLPLPGPPQGSRYQPSLNTPTPYSMPEFCFAWDMLLRSRRDPYTAAAMRQ